MDLLKRILKVQERSVEHLPVSFHKYSSEYFSSRWSRCKMWQCGRHWIKMNWYCTIKKLKLLRLLIKKTVWLSKMYPRLLGKRMQINSLHMLRKSEQVHSQVGVTFVLFLSTFPVNQLISSLEWSWTTGHMKISALRVMILVWLWLKATQPLTIVLRVT